MDKPTITVIAVKDLQPAAWNYKTNGTKEQIEKLKRSIEFDRSAGVLAVRELDNGKYEVIDGNHRLRAIQELQWEQVSCENFGKIPQARAVTISRRRNEQWFEDDKLKLAELYRDVVLKEFELEELVAIMPETSNDIEQMIAALDFNWEAYEKKVEKVKDVKQEQIEKLSLLLTSTTLVKWKTFRKQTKDLSDDQALSLLLQLNDQQV